jgi:branched-subunit amino acid ABC-type transport system permease component
MSSTVTESPIAGALPVVIVIAASAVTAIAIAAWLVYRVALRAIDKAPPEGVAAVILALGALLNPLRLFLPWPSRSEPGGVPHVQDGVRTAAVHNEAIADRHPGDQS